MRVFLSELVNNFPIVAALICLCTSQIIKMAFFYFKQKRFDWRHMVTAGGMPSSHAAMVAGLATAVGLQEGWMSPSFAMAVIFSSVVMYDAAGVRRAAGRQARVLNQMLEEGKLSGNRLQELLGHTPIEVFIGAFYGIILTILIYGRFAK